MNNNNVFEYLYYMYIYLNNRDGMGVLKLSSGIIYEGSFFDGRPHGHGRMASLQTGYIYEGNFSDGSIQGNGVLITPEPGSKRVQQHWPERTKNQSEITLPSLVRYVLQKMIYYILKWCIFRITVCHYYLLES